MKPLERARGGRGGGRQGGWRREAQLAGASNWAEQVSMADQSRMQHGEAGHRLEGWREE